MTDTELRDLLREARAFVLAGCAHGSISYTQWSREQHTAARVLNRIDAALAESPDSTPPVVEWHKDEFFGNETVELDDERFLGVAKRKRSKGWFWNVGGKAATEEEAKAKAIALSTKMERGRS